MGAKVGLFGIYGTGHHVIFEHGGSAARKGNWHHATLCHIAGLLLRLNLIICTIDSRQALPTRLPPQGTCAKPRQWAAFCFHARAVQLPP